MGKVIIAIVAVAAVALIVLVTRLISKKKKHKEEEYQASKQRRDESLKAALANPMTEKAVKQDEYKPYKVTYKAENDDTSKDDTPSLQIEKESKISKEKYIFRSDKTIVIGKQFGKCGVFGDKENVESLFRIIYYEDAYCIVSDSGITAELRRGSKKMTIEGDAVKLRSGDVLNCEGVLFRFTLV
ncbi:MAG: hypothetical protein J6Y89_06180 [Lachnospiraceae bacterium]|nr:hypothetical protein [Lachnospiraceae bacterium]